MYANILLSTDGPHVARKGVEHDIALRKIGPRRLFGKSDLNQRPSQLFRSPPEPIRDVRFRPNGRFASPPRVVAS